MNPLAVYSIFVGIGALINGGLYMSEQQNFSNKTLTVPTRNSVVSDKIKNTDKLIYCTDNSDCNFPKGTCKEYTDTLSVCVCKDGFTNKNDDPCTYKQKDKVAAFLLSLFLGEFGADWFYLARGDDGYIVAGVFKLLTIGGLGVWWLVDWIRVLADSFDDGNGYPIGPW